MSRSYLTVAALASLTLAACDTSTVEPPMQEAYPFEGVISGAVNGVPFSDSLQARFDADYGLSLSAYLSDAPALCALKTLFSLDAEAGTQSLEYATSGAEPAATRGLLVSDGGSDYVCRFYVPTESEANRIELVAGGVPGEFMGTFRATLVGDADNAGGVDTLRIEDGRLRFVVSLDG